MCKAPKPPPQKEPEKPEWLRNPYLDAAIGQSAAVNQLRTGRSQLRIDLNSGLGLRQPGTALPQPSNTPRSTPNRPRTQANPLDAWRSRLPAIAAL